MSAAERPPYRRLSVIVPVYNERATVGPLLDRVLAAPLPAGLEKELVIVLAPCTDGTEQVVARYEGRPSVSVLREPSPRGKGAAVRAGLTRATGDLVLIQDGDLEYNPEDYARLLVPMLEGRCDVVFGSRALDPKQQWQYRQFSGALERLYGAVVNWGGLVYTNLFNLLYGTRLTDGATMFKIYRGDDLRVLTLRSDGFDYDWEIIAKLAKKGRIFADLPVPYKARSRAEGKKIRFWRDGWRVFRAIVTYRFFD